MNSRKKIASFLLAGTMGMGIVLSPHPVLASTTENVKAIQLGTSAIQSPTKTYRNDTSTAEYYFDPNSYIYFGQVSSANPSKPIKWRVLDAERTLAGTSGMFLLAETSLGPVDFFTGTANTPSISVNLQNYDDGQKWDGSNAQAKCKVFVAEGNKNFTTQELSMITSSLIQDKSTTNSNLFGPASGDNFGPYSWELSRLTENDKLFYLSASELERYVANYNYAPTLSLKPGKDEILDAQWGLRSFFTTREYGKQKRGLAYVSSGVVAGFPEKSSTGNAGAHPAMNIKKDSILFTKSVDCDLTSSYTSSNSTSSAGVKLEDVNLVNNQVNQPTTWVYSWKLVLQDDSHNNFLAGLESGSKNQQSVGYADWEVTVNYSNAKIDSSSGGGNSTFNAADADSSTDEYISAMLVDSTGEVLCYGGQKVSEANGKVSFVMPDDLPQGRYTLKIFNEQRNGTYKTDYSSGFSDIPLTVGNPSSGSGSSGAGSSNGVRMYRLYNPNSGEHFYTARLAEKEYLVRQGWSYEGIAWIAPRESNRPVYRLYNPNAGDHHYTMNLEERDALIALGWKDEGIGWYSSPGKEDPIYRQYNPNASNGTHNYTRSKDENDYLVAIGWRPEGIGWYGIQWNLPSSEEK